jgi:hypothetical protein
MLLNTIYYSLMRNILPKTPESMELSSEFLDSLVIHAGLPSIKSTVLKPSVYSAFSS